MVEVQFHTPESFAAKSENHGLYELIRSGQLDREEMAAAQELQAQRNEQVGRPPDWDRLEPRVDARTRPVAAGIPPDAFPRVREKLAALSAAREEGGHQAAGSGLHSTGGARPPGLPPAARRRMRPGPDRSAAAQRDWGEPYQDGARRGGAER